MREYLSCDYLFYSVIGKHGGESVKEIIGRKQKEIESGGFSLWSAQIDRKSKEQVWNLSKNDTVFVLCKINPSAKDPTDNKEVITARTMITPTGEESIPTIAIKTTFSKGKKYQAYVVKNYVFYDSPEDFDFGKYESVLADNTTKSFSDRFKNTLFQNTFGRKNDRLRDSCNKPISAMMELQYPFVVDIK